MSELKQATEDSASALRIIELGPGDCSRIEDLERASFVPGLQADGETILKRFALGHIMYATEEDGLLSAMVAFSCASFDPMDRAAFPATFREFSTLPKPLNYNAAFVYNLEVRRACRGRQHVRCLLGAAFERARGDGCVWAVGDGRIPSYNGSAGEDQESVALDTHFRDCIDRHLAGGPLPTVREFQQDATLALYRRLTGCDFLWVIPNFIPEDRASGGIRVILYGDLRARLSEKSASRRTRAESPLVYEA